MTGLKPGQRLTLGIHPTSRGFGWIAFEGPFTPFDWCIATIRGDKNARCLHRIERLINRLEPETLVLESFDKSGSVRSPRIRRLCQALIGLAIDRGIEVAVYSRADIQSCFKHVGAATRQEIAEAVARHVDALRHRLPKQRRAWESEDKRMALFSAAALVLTHFQRGAWDLLDRLKDRAA